MWSPRALIPTVLLAASPALLLAGCGRTPQGLERACSEVQAMADLAPTSEEYVDRQREALALVDQYLARHEDEDSAGLADTIQRSVTAGDLDPAVQACEG